MDFTCKNCKKRLVGCHATCQEYREAKKEWNARTEQIRKEKDLAYMITSYEGRVREKWRKIKHTRGQDR